MIPPGPGLLNVLQDAERGVRTVIEQADGPLATETQVRILAERLGAFHELGHLDGPVEQRVMSVDVEVDERVWRDNSRIRCLPFHAAGCSLSSEQCEKL